MNESDKLIPAVSRFISSLPKKKKLTTDDVEHFTFKKELHCFACGFPTVHYREGIFQNPENPKKKYKEWVVTYMCDLCKGWRNFKYIPPDQKLKFVPSKLRN